MTTPAQGKAVQTTSSAVSGAAGAIGGIIGQFNQRRALKAFAEARERFAQQEAEERRRVGELEFQEAIRRSTDLRREAVDIEAIGLRNAQEIRVEGERLVQSIALRSEAQGVDFSGSAAEVAAAAAGAAEFAAAEEIRETSRASDALLFEAKEVSRAGRERRRASIIGAQSARNQGAFEAATLRFRTPSALKILSSGIKPLKELPTAIHESLLAIKAARAEDIGGVEDTFIADPFEQVDF